MALIVRLLISTFILFLGISPLSSPESAHAAPATLSFGGTERSVPRSTILIVTTFDLQTGEVVETLTTKPRSRITVQCPARFCISAVQATAFVRIRGRRHVREYLGFSKGFGSEVTAARNRTVRIAVRSTRPAARSAASRSRSLPAGGLRVGVPAGGITINRELAQMIGSSRGIASAVITTMVQAPCYRTGEDFSVIEVDPRILRERKKEFDLIKQGYVKREPGFRDRYQPPNATVRGSVSLSGSSATATLELRNSTGQVIASGRGSTTEGGWFEAVDAAARDLAGALCPGPRVAINYASCRLERCTCGRDPGLRIKLSVEGTSKLPVGGFMYANLPTAQKVGHDCGGSAQFSLAGSALGCNRPTAELPENFNFSFSTVSPEPGGCFCPGDGAPTEFDFIATAIDPASGKRDDAVVEGVACRVVG